MNPSQPQQDILIIDDNPHNLSVLSELFQMQGYHVRVATTGHRGLEAARQVKPDLIMLDISMPDLDGFKVCEALKRDPSLAGVPVIFVSAHEELLDKKRAFEVGGADYVQKPFQVQEVLLRAQHQLRLASLQAELQENNKSLENAKNGLQQALLEAEGLNHELINVNERLRQSEDLQSRFLSKMRHEINNPLSSILGLANQIRDGHLSEEHIKTLGSLIQIESFHLDFQLRNIFAAADLESGVAIPTITQVDVDSVLLNVMDAFSQQAAFKSVKLILEPRVAPGSLIFNTDAGMLRIVAANLLANAIEFSLANTEVRLNAALEGDTLKLGIQDQGIGIHPEFQSLIFDRFRQLDEEPTRAHPGQGLGLPVTKALVELMNGRIEVQSQLGEGALFTCQLPPFTLMDDANTSSFEGNMFIFESPEEL